MTPEQEAKMDRLLEQQGKVHYTLFGAEGEGGLVRDVKALKAHREDILAFKAKMLGMVTGASLLASFAGSKIAAFFKSSN